MHPHNIIPEMHSRLERIEAMLDEMVAASRAYQASKKRPSVEADEEESKRKAEAAKLRRAERTRERQHLKEVTKYAIKEYRKSLAKDEAFKSEIGSYMTTVVDDKVDIAGFVAAKFEGLTVDGKEHWMKLGEVAKELAEAQAEAEAKVEAAAALEAAAAVDLSSDA